MKALTLFLVLSFTAAVGLAQQTPAPPAASPHHADSDHAMTMHHHMEMQQQVAKMRATLEKMKANLDKISDPAVKQQAQLDVELWDAMVQHMEGMVKMMTMHGGMMGGGDHSGMEKKDGPK